MSERNRGKAEEPKTVNVNIPASTEPQEFRINLEETILLESGKYCISLQIVDWDDDARPRPGIFYCIAFTTEALTVKKLLGPGVRMRY